MSCGNAEVSWNGDEATLFAKYRGRLIEVENLTAGVLENDGTWTPGADADWAGYINFPEGPWLTRAPTRQEAVRRVEAYWHDGNPRLTDVAAI